MIWLPRDAQDGPAAGAGAPWDGPDPELPWRAYFKATAESCTRTAVEGGKEEFDRKISRLRLGSDLKSIPHEHGLSLKEEVIKKLCDAMCALHGFYPLEGASLVRLYAFYALLRDFGQQPFRTATTVGRLLYGLDDDRLRHVFEEDLRPLNYSGSSDTWEQRRALDVEKVFRGGAEGWWRDPDGTREADERERGHLLHVLRAVPADLALPPLPGARAAIPHEGYFRPAYAAVLEAEEIVWKVLGKRQRPRDMKEEDKKEPLHRRHHRVERVAGHLVVCAECGGIPRLLAEAPGAAAGPEAELRVPAHFPRHWEDDER